MCMCVHVYSSTMLLLCIHLLIATFPLSLQQEAVVINGMPTVYNGIASNLTGCSVFPDSDIWKALCTGQNVLTDGAIGSSDISGVDQVKRFLVWHRTVQSFSIELHLTSPFTLSHVDIYTLNMESAKIGLHEKPTAIAISLNGHESYVTNISSCIFEVEEKSLMITRLLVKKREVVRLMIEFRFSNTANNDWIFISEIVLFQEDDGSQVICKTSHDSTVPPESVRQQIPLLSIPPPTGATVIPNLDHPDTVTITCSVYSPPSNDYTYQWQWWRNGTLLNNDTRLTIIQTTNTQSTSLIIADLRHSDEGSYSCLVQFASCSDNFDCNYETQVKGTTQLKLPIVVLVRSSRSCNGESVMLICSVYGYPHNALPPIWSLNSNSLMNESKHSITMYNVDLLNSNSISSTDGVKSHLSVLINDTVSFNTNGDYKCSVEGNSSTYSLNLPLKAEESIEHCKLGITIVCTAAIVLLLSLTINGVMVSLLYKMRHSTSTKPTNDRVENSRQETNHDHQPQPNEIIYEEVDQVIEDTPVYYSYPKQMEKNIAPESKDGGVEEYIHIMPQSQHETGIEVTAENHTVQVFSASSVDEVTSDIKMELSAEKEEIHYVIPSKNQIKD